MNDFPAEFPRQFKSKRLLLRSYQPGDGKWYYTMSLRNREHLKRYEAENVASNVANENVAEELMQELSEAWQKRIGYFIGVFEKHTGEFVAQIYVGPVDWQLPEFQIGYFSDVDHQGVGYVTEAVKATLEILFKKMGAHRVRLVCDQTNLRSIRVAERCNMTLEGVSRENKRNPDGTYSNSLIYALVKAENLKFNKEFPQDGDSAEVGVLLINHWRSTRIVSRGKVTDATQLPRIVGRGVNGKLIGLLTYLIDQESHSCEVVSLNSESEGRGIGSRLIGMVEAEAKEKGCKRVWLITTNDNVEAAAFYAKRGYRLKAIHINALKRSREFKPEISMIGKHGIPLLDEWEFEKLI